MRYEKKKKCPAPEAMIPEGLRTVTKNHDLDGTPLFLASELLTWPDVDDETSKTPERVAINVSCSFHCSTSIKVPEGLLPLCNITHL